MVSGFCLAWYAIERVGCGVFVGGVLGGGGGGGEGGGGKSGMRKEWWRLRGGGVGRGRMGRVERHWSAVVTTVNKPRVLERVKGL